MREYRDTGNVLGEGILYCQYRQGLYYDSPDGREAAEAWYWAALCATCGETYNWCPCVVDPRGDLVIPCAACGGAPSQCEDGCPACGYTWCSVAEAPDCCYCDEGDVCPYLGLPIGGYRDAPPGRPRGVSSATWPRYVGIEIEVSEVGDGEWSRLRRVVEDLGAVVKEDGSLGSLGREIVLPPLRGREVSRWVPRVCEALQRGGAAVRADAGLHVHVDRAGLGAFDVDLIDEAWIRSLEGDALALCPRSRMDNDYCGRAEHTPSDDRYRTLNLTKRETLEFRLWGGTIVASKILLAARVSSRIVELGPPPPARLYQVLDGDWYRACMARAKELGNYLPEAG